VASETALGYLAPAAEIAGAAVFFASDLARPITGQFIGVDAGQWI
jgi:enoyl-[acyl-carrier-protein] reductase (NADH)